MAQANRSLKERIRRLQQKYKRNPQEPGNESTDVLIPDKLETMSLSDEISFASRWTGSLPVNGKVNYSVGNWTSIGASPQLHDVDVSNYSYPALGYTWCYYQYWTFTDIPGEVSETSISGATLWIRYFTYATERTIVQLAPDGISGSWIDIYDGYFPDTSGNWTWITIDVSSWITTRDQVNSTLLGLRAYKQNAISFTEAHLVVTLEGGL